MAMFKMVTKPELKFKRPKIVDNSVLLNKTGTVSASFSSVEVEVCSGGLVKRHTSQRAVVNAPDGAEVLCYFWRNNEWHIIVVEQFRIAILKQTVEAPGGEVDTTSDILSIKRIMARELQEEANIHIDNPDAIEVVFSEQALPSLLSGTLWGGILEVNESQLPVDHIAGEWGEGEYTVIKTMPLVELLKKRDQMEIEIDLWLSRLLDEVAKKTGLLLRNY